ncbi:MAG: hypothetical protein KDH88_02315 [Chromatiales bacterium]|nr:hypothetical protein [Chromatiales bacterium]
MQPPGSSGDVTMVAQSAENLAERFSDRPRLRTYLVPWLGSASARLPPVAGSDLGDAFTLAASADNLGDYASFTICGADFLALREVISYIASRAGVPK